MNDQRGGGNPDPPIGASCDRLDSWLLSVFHRGNRSYPVAHFPSDEILEEYVNTLDQRNENDVKKLLRRLLVPSVTFNSAELSLMALNDVRETRPDRYERMIEREYWRRLGGIDGNDQPQWLGITWILDLLPHHPAMALEALNAFFVAHMQVMSDTIVHGIYDAEAVIRAYWIGNPKSNQEKMEFLISLTPRMFEHLVKRLYDAMGFSTSLTPPSRDGGRDVIATKSEPGLTERLLIEAKLYGGAVGVRFGRALLGVVADEKANKGVLVSNSKYTSGVIGLASRNSTLDLIDGIQLVKLLNEHLGTDWPLRIDSIVASSIRENDKKAAV